MIAEERSIINRFLAKHDLHHVTGLKVGSLDDLAKAEGRGNLRRKRFELVLALLKEYQGKSSVDVVSAAGGNAARSLGIQHFYPYQYLDDYSEEDFALYLKYVRAICEGLCVVFPPENGGAA